MPYLGVEKETPIEDVTPVGAPVTWIVNGVVKVFGFPEASVTVAVAVPLTAEAEAATP